MAEMNTSSEPRTVGVVPAGAHAQFELSLDDLRPRTLLPVLDVPLVGHTLNRFREAGLTQVTICANSSSPRVRRELGDGSKHGVELYYFDDHTPRGPGGCVRDAVLETGAQRAVVIDGSVLATFDLRGMIAAHEKSCAAATVAAYRQPGGRAGTPAGLVPAGIYIFERSAIEQIHATGYQDIKEVLLPKLSAASDCVRPYVVDTPCPRIGDLGSYLSASEWMLQRAIAGETVMRGYRRRDAALIHTTARVEPGADLHGPVLIGPGVVVEADATLVGPVIIGSRSVVAAGATVCRSIVWEDARIAGGAFVDACVVTHVVRVTSHARCMNSMLVATGAARSALRQAELGDPAGDVPRHRPTKPGSTERPAIRRGRSAVGLEN